ncbi:helix-turn-helix domain-containing protein [Pontibacillus salipaludis]|uniref:helix-turn-helix domain-containing protein n=1 Tax=Pontibacillus salipaludis TaxID=1697394 RepID=UPI0031EDD611
MFQDLGKRVRMLREQKGIGLNTYAKTLGVSPGYLSNLETGKTDTIELTLLSKLQDEFTIFPLQKEESEIDYRLSRILEQLKTLNNFDPLAVDYLLQTIEKGIEVMNKGMK